VPDNREFASSCSVAQITKMANAYQESRHELLSFQPLGLDPGVVAVILIPERDPVTFHRQQTRVADGDSVRVAGQIIHHSISLVEAGLGVNHPLLLHQAGEHVISLTAAGNSVQVTGVHRSPQQRYHSPPKTPG